MVDLALRVVIAQRLSEIVRLCGALRVQAWHCHDDKDIPGGDALVMIGPVATMSVWEEQIERAEDAYFDGLAPWLAVEDRDSDPTPPLLVLAGWEDVVRDEREQPTRRRATIDGAVTYLRHQLDWLVGDDDVSGEPLFPAVDALVRDLGRLQTRLENVLHDGIRLDRGVPCMTCGTLLVKVWGVDATGKGDRWHCKPCHEWSTIEQYNLAVKAAARAHRAALTGTEMEEQYRVPHSTLRVWVHRGEVRRRGRDGSGRTLYDVADTLAKRDADGATPRADAV